MTRCLSSFQRECIKTDIYTLTRAIVQLLQLSLDFRVSYIAIGHSSSAEDVRRISAPANDPIKKNYIFIDKTATRHAPLPHSCPFETVAWP